MDYEVAIIGGGPAGSYSAIRSSDIGYRTLLLEEHHESGRPQQCAGLVNPSIFGLKALNDISVKVVLKEVYGADVFSPSGHVLSLRGKTPKAVSIDRASFDKELLRLAARNGTSIMMGQRAISVKKRPGKGWVVRSKGRFGERTIECGLLLGCDGPASIVRRCSGLDCPRETLTGLDLEAVVTDGDVPSDKVGVFTGHNTAAGFFAWAIPTHGRSGLRIGASSIHPNALLKGFQGLLKDHRLLRFLDLGPGSDLRLKESSINLGPIPMGCPERIVGPDLVLLGDSAGMAKPTSGGGIYPLLLAVDQLFSILRKTGRTDRPCLERFQSEWERGYGKELEKALSVRRVISEINDDEVDVVLKRLSRKRTLETINSEGDIDHPMTLAMSVLRTDPGLITLLPRFVPYLKKVL